MNCWLRFSDCRLYSILLMKVLPKPSISVVRVISITVSHPSTDVFPAFAAHHAPSIIGVISLAGSTPVRRQERVACQRCKAASNETLQKSDKMAAQRRTYTIRTMLSTYRPSQLAASPHLMSRSQFFWHKSQCFCP